MALVQLEEAIGIIESLRARVRTPELRAGLMSSRREIYEAHIDLLMELHLRDPDGAHARAALAASERARARTLLDLISEGEVGLQRQIVPEMRQRRATVQDRLNAKATHLYQLLGGAHSEAEITAAEQEMYLVLRELDAVEAEIREHNPRYADLSQPKLVSLAEIQALLGEDTVLLEYALGSQRSFLWRVTRGSFSAHVLPGRDEIESAARAVFSELSTLDVRAVKQERQSLDHLSRILLGPLAGEPAGSRLVVVADGALHYIPFAALTIPGAVRSQHQLHSHEVVHLPSASVLARLRSSSNRPSAQPSRLIALLADPIFSQHDPRLTGLTAVGQAPAQRSAEATAASTFNRLPATRREVEAIAALAPAGETLLALDADANRAAVVGEQLKPFRIIHLATHGRLDTQNPQLSGLVLSLFNQHGEPQDGFLDLYDVYSLDLNAELVVLSGCQTALGKETRGEGLVGLTRGFMYAGVPRVVASLWQVPDRATAELMSAFYHGIWEEHLPPAAALRTAQMTIYQQKRWRDPYYWAAFVLLGDW
jgi:CHAT domain-containing protein